MSAIGLTVKHGDTLGLVLDYDENTREYDVDFEDGRRFKTAHVNWVPEIGADPVTALYRQSNRSERLYFEDGYGWDVTSADDDLFPVDQQQQALVDRDPMNIPQRDVDPAWGLEPDAGLTFYPSNPDLENQENTHPFFDVAPKPTREDQESYPSMAATAAGGLNEHRQPPEPPADWGDEPNLERCPNCGGYMTDAVDHQSAHCEECGHTQPIDYLSRIKQAAPLPIAPLVEGVEALGAGAEAGGSASMAAGGGLGMVDDLIGSAVQAGGHNQMGQGGGGAAGDDPDLAKFQQTLAANEDTDDSTGANRNDGRDSSPATADTNSYEGKDGPENLKDVGGSIGSDLPEPLSLFSSPAVIQYLKAYGDSDKSGADDPLVRGLDELMAMRYPGQYQRKIKSFVETHDDYMEKVAARKGKMCPFHSDLVDYALELGDPAAATAALSRHMYSPNSCKGGWAGDDPRKPSKCRFKPQMIKQDYWDEKERQAEERKQQREQLMAEQPMQDPNAISPEMPVDQPSAVGVPEEMQETQEFQEIEPGHMVVQDVPGTDPLVAPTDYNPSPQGDTNVAPIESAPSYSPAPMPVAARVAMATDASGQPLVKGQVYEMLSANRGDVIPDIVQITSSDDTNINFVVKGKNGITYQDSLPVASISTEGITFRPHAHNPNAHGLPLDSVSESQGNTDNTHYVGPGKDDLDSGANSHGAKTAGRSFSVTEQNMFIGEPGQARNLDKLDLSGTHYQEEADLNDDFVTGW